MKWRLAAAALAVTFAAGAAHAGRTCEEKSPAADKFAQGLNLAYATAQELDRSGAQVVVLARAGQNLSDYGLRWSHIGIAYRDEAAGQPVWRVLHKLNHCGTATADLYRQGLGEFFLDDPYRYEAAYAVLRPEVQQALLPILRNGARAAAMHGERYNMLAYPWSVEYQQSNQWVTETLASAIAPADVFTRQQAQVWLKDSGYRPSDLRISAAKRLGARIGMANIAFDDHPSEKRFSGHIETTTADSVFSWLARSKFAEAPRFVSVTDR